MLKIPTSVEVNVVAAVASEGLIYASAVPIYFTIESNNL